MTNPADEFLLRQAKKRYAEYQNKVEQLNSELEADTRAALASTVHTDDEKEQLILNYIWRVNQAVKVLQSAVSQKDIQRIGFSLEGMRGAVFMDGGWKLP